MENEENGREKGAINPVAIVIATGTAVCTGREFVIENLFGGEKMAIEKLE